MTTMELTPGDRRARLRNPPNAVADPGIDLKRSKHRPFQGSIRPPAPAKPRVVLQPQWIEPYTFKPGPVCIDPEVYPPADQALTVERIRTHIGKAMNISVVDMVSERRTAKVVWPRQIAMYLACILTTRSLPDIGRRFGGRDHTTVLYAREKVKARRLVDAALDAELNRYQAELTA